MALWAEKVKKVQKEISLAIVAANNHCAGFGPAAANGFRKMIGLKAAALEEMKQIRITQYAQQQMRLEQGQIQEASL